MVSNQLQLLIFAFVFIVKVISKNSDEIFTSIADLRDLLIVEEQLVTGLNEYVRAEEKKLEQIKRHIQDYESVRDKASGDPDKYIGNPLNAFHLIKKMTLDWSNIKALLNKSLSQTLLRNMSILQWPTGTDMTGAANSLSRLQDTYKLSVKDMANGNLNGVNHNMTLTVNDCFEMGVHCYNLTDYKNTKLWMHQAMEMLERGEVEQGKTITKGDILEQMAETSFKQGDVNKALQFVNEALKLTLEQLEIMPNDLRALKKKVLLSDVLENENDILQYGNLCRGEQQITETYHSNLFCRYSFGFHPFLRLAPHKEEDAFLEPRIVIYHDVITDTEIEAIKRMSAPKLKRARVGNYMTSETRIAETVFLNLTKEMEELLPMYRRVEDITGLNMNSSEYLQVSNYGIGGQNEPHTDFYGTDSPHYHSTIGDRIATWLIYKSDVEQGGATVFPRLGVGILPRKGSAVFWYNLYRNGTGDFRTTHAGCPVLSGSKWVSNFWIKERGQEFTRPCLLNSLE